MSVRRLAAIDMYGVRGTVRLRRLILAEFVVGVVGMVGIGSWILIQSSDWGGQLLGLWFIGAGLNYAPLAMYAIVLSRAGALAGELEGVETGSELRHYGVFQLWILVPFALAVLSARDLLSPKTGHGGENL